MIFGLCSSCCLSFRHDVSFENLGWSDFLLTWQSLHNFLLLRFCCLVLSIPRTYWFLSLMFKCHQSSFRAHLIFFRTNSPNPFLISRFLIFLQLFGTTNQFTFLLFFHHYNILARFYFSLVSIDHTISLIFDHFSDEASVVLCVKQAQLICQFVSWKR